MTKADAPALDAVTGLPLAGYRGPGSGTPIPERRRVEGGEGTPFAGFWVELDAGLTNGQREALRRNTYWWDLHRLMAPLVLGWNYVAETVEAVAEPPVYGEDGATELVPARTVHRVTGEEWLPPPCDAGPDVFLRVDAATKRWIRDRLIGLPELDGEALELLRRLAGTPDGAHDGSAPAGSGSPSPIPSPPSPPPS